MKSYLLPENIRLALVDYLGNRPFRESAPLIEALSRLAEAPAEDGPPRLKAVGEEGAN